MLAAAMLPPRLRTALDAGAATDDVADAVLALPLGIVEIAVRSAAEPAWVDGIFGSAGFVLAASDDDTTLMTGVVPALALQIALLVALGPRPVPDDDEAAVGDFDGFDAALATPGLPHAVSAVLLAPGVARWHARLTWADELGPAAREVSVIDGGCGLLLWAAVPETKQMALVPCSSTDVWRRLCGLAPQPPDLL